MNRYEPVSFKKHEVRMQELRSERKSDGLRLEGLKKALQARLNSDLKALKEFRAA